MSEGDNMDRKIASLIVVALLVVTAGAFIAVDHDPVDADTTTTGTVNVYYNASGSSTWTSSTQDAYNLYLAVYGARTSLGYSMATTGANTQWYVTTGGYSNPNTSYGLISEINGSTTFSIYGYNTTNASWDDISSLPLGWLRPYADYSAVTVVGAVSSVYANVAIVQGNASTSSISTTDLASPVSVQGNSSYYYTFLLCDSTATVTVPSGTSVKVPSGSSYVSHTLTTAELQAGITVCGYGSDAYLALLDAVGSSLVGQTTSWIDQGSYYTYYSWMDSLFGVGTVSQSNSDGSMTYYYWMSMDNEGNYLNWTLGYYSTVHFDQTNVKSNFVITYAFS